MRRLKKVDCTWSTDLAYAVGLITADGNLSPNGRHINFTTKDKELALHFKKCLRLSNKIGRKSRGYDKENKKYYVVQFGDKNFYEFLLGLGLHPAKSKTLNKLSIPDEYFRDFLRGCVDGDGCISVHRHPESNYMQLKLRLVSASPNFLKWIKDNIELLNVASGGWIDARSQKNVHVLSYGKADTISLVKYMYHGDGLHFLDRKFKIAKPFLGEWRNWSTRTA